jgi:thermitase
MAVARANNGVGGCGAAPESLLIPIACMPDQVGSQSTLARALAYAALPSREVASQSDDEGADVIVCSLGPNDADWMLQSVLRQAIDEVAELGRGRLGTPLFWAVSNGTFPISLDEVVSHPSVIRVGRSNRFDRNDGSAYGPELDFLAPGAAVLTTTSGGGHAPVTGTSFAAPLAAGVGALVIARNPTWTATQLRDHLRATCDQIGGVNYVGGHHPEYGYGRLNADRAVP